MTGCSTDFRPTNLSENLFVWGFLGVPEVMVESLGAARNRIRVLPIDAVLLLALGEPMDGVPRVFVAFEVPGVLLSA